ncbi:MAG: type II toxin-antitoxin system HicB family antitoxin [Bacteroidales bacterium]
MNQLLVTIERAESNYSAYLSDIDGITTTGSSIDEIKQRICESIDLYIEGCEIAGVDVPEQLKGDYRLQFQMDVKSVLDFYAGIFTKAGLERITGINQKQLWHYASGDRKPRPEQALKLERALHKLGQELLSITF